MRKSRSLSVNFILGIIFACAIIFSSILHAPLAHATTTTPSQSDLQSAITYVTNFSEYQTYANDPSSTTLPHYKEYAHLRTIVSELTYLHDNYDSIANDPNNSWKISYLIDYSHKAIRSCEYLLGLRQTSVNSSANIDNVVAQNQNQETISSPPNDNADSSSIPTQTTIISPQTKTTDNNAANSNPTSSVTVEQPAVVIPSEPATTLTSNTTSTAEPQQQATETNSENPLASTTAHTATALSGAGILLATKRRYTNRLSNK